MSADGTNVHRPRQWDIYQDVHTAPTFRQLGYRLKLNAAALTHAVDTEPLRAALAELVELTDANTSTGAALGALVDAAVGSPLRALASLEPVASKGIKAVVKAALRVAIRGQQTRLTLVRRSTV